MYAQNANQHPQSQLAIHVLINQLFQQMTGKSFEVGAVLPHEWKTRQEQPPSINAATFDPPNAIVYTFVDRNRSGIPNEITGHAWTYSIFTIDDCTVVSLYNPYVYLFAVLSAAVRRIASLHQLKFEVRLVNGGIATHSEFIPPKPKLHLRSV